MPIHRVAITDTKTQDNVVDKFLALANASTLEEARGLPSSVLQAANRLLISNSAYGTSTCGPVVDGDYVPKLPDQLLAEGRFRRDVELIIGSTDNEGLVFTSPAVTNDTEYRRFLEETYSNSSPEILDHIANTLYPPIFDGSFGYTNQTQRAAVTKTESEFTCRYGFMEDAYGEKAKSYHFNVFPSLHEGDLPYAFYDSRKPPTGANATTALVFQQLLTSFANNGTPTSPGLQNGIPVYGKNRLMLGLESEGFRVVSDPSSRGRCEFWQQGLYL